MTSGKQTLNPAEDDNVAQQNHWTERGRAASVCNSSATGRPRRSVLAFGDRERLVSIRESFKALVQKRDGRGRWVYLLWLAGYCVLAFIATAYAAVLGQDYLSAFLFFLVPALVGYVQFRSPTLLGWVLLFIPAGSPK